MTLVGCSAPWSREVFTRRPREAQGDCSWGGAALGPDSMGFAAAARAMGNLSRGQQSASRHFIPAVATGVSPA